MSTVPALHPISPSQLGRESCPCDALVILAAAPVLRQLANVGLPAAVVAGLERAFATDAALSRPVVRPPVVLAVPEAPGGRVVLAMLGAMTDDVDDVRAVGEAAHAATSRAIEAGARTLALLTVLPAGEERYARAIEVAALGALGSLWMPLEAREAGWPAPALEGLWVAGLTAARAAYVRAIETGRALARDITGTEPERMAPLQAAAWCQQAFEGTGVAVSVEHEVARFPLMAAVARASMAVERHRPCIVRLEHQGPGPVTRTVFIAGKGITYDTGGADVKTDGSMAGMSRDKGGAGAAAGLVRALAALGTPGLRVVALLGFARNSTGPDCFVSDEVLRAHSGVRVRVGNTDAEGRLLLADLLSCLREEAIAGAPSPLLLSIATLTGHVYRAFGPYAGALENGPARARGVIATLAAQGESWGEPFEWTRVRREDYAFVAPRSPAEDCVSSNRLATVNTPRGHQGPFAFLDVASGLRASGLPFAHLDVGGVVVAPADWQFGRPTGAPVAALAAWLSTEA